MYNGGVVIGYKFFYVFGCADNILLRCLTVSGLQQMTEVSNECVSNLGLSFYPNKTECIIFGECYFKERPVWHLNINILKMLYVEIPVSESFP